MKVLILIDADNFRNSIANVSKSRSQFRYVDYYKINSFVMNYLKSNLQYKNCQLKHLRTYYYTGKFTDNLITRIEKRLENETKPTTQSILKEKLAKAKKSKQIQSEFLKLAKNYYFFEVRSKPLQFSPSTLKIFQKGVDVQIAVDLVEFAYKNIFDIVVLLSGDIDLLESVKMAKNMGKHVVILGDESVTSQEMKRETDLYINIRRLNDKELDKISHLKKPFQKKQ